MAEEKKAKPSEAGGAPIKGSAKVKGTTASTQPREDVDNEEEDATYDLGPWAETPSSTRVKAYRFDYAKRAIQVTWRNGKTPPGYVYEDIPYETFRSFARATSKGKFINSTLNAFPRDTASDTDINAKSNGRRRAVSRRFE